MNIIPKNDLIDGAYYEGELTEPEFPIVARWNASLNSFEYAIWHWSGTLYALAIYWDEESEYYPGFCPTELTDPREYQRVENL